MEKVWVVLANFITVLVVSIFAALPIMWCWNGTMPDIFSLPRIGWGQAFALNFLAMSFFKGSPFIKL